MYRLSSSRPGFAAQGLIDHLAAFAPLTEDERGRVREAVGPCEVVRPGHELPRSTEKRRTKLLANGWACRQRSRASGSRQIFDFILPGDLIKPYPSLHSQAVDVTIALTRVEVAPVAAFEDGGEDAPLAHALEAARQEEEARLFDHLMRLGRLSAVERAGHLFLELYDRLARVGQASQGRFMMPLTQEILADALGLSVVHVNRILQQLRREGMIELRVGFVTLLQPDVLASAVDYVPLQTAPAAQSGARPAPFPPQIGASTRSS